MKVLARYFEFQPGNGTRYSIILYTNPHGGIDVSWPKEATYRWHPSENKEEPGYLQFLHGKENEFDMHAILIWLDENVNDAIFDW